MSDAFDAPSPDPPLLIFVNGRAAGDAARNSAHSSRGGSDSTPWTSSTLADAVRARRSSGTRARCPTCASSCAAATEPSRGSCRPSKISPRCDANPPETRVRLPDQGSSTNARRDYEITRAPAEAHTRPDPSPSPPLAPGAHRRRFVSLLSCPDPTSAPRRPLRSIPNRPWASSPSARATTSRACLVGALDSTSPSFARSPRRYAHPPPRSSTDGGDGSRRSGSREGPLAPSAP